MAFLNLPNQLTLSRIAVVPLLLALLWLDRQWSCLLAAGLLILAGITDVADGYLARRERQITNLGKFLDPLADKVLICSVLIMLVAMGRVNAWIAILMICRELMVTGLRAIAAEAGIIIAADRYGKLKTIMQFTALVPVMVHYSWLGLPFETVGQFLLYMALALTVFSGWNYFRTFFREQSEKKTTSSCPDEE
ncbi:MAG: CDP-diacylglycerol--glycerol-3-phosphate 3-phosphatidyltransferase [Deltaproteobacteria bacterium]|jgi:CDP-diacylglycerol--glycerol-3-phosphate 3-phosphatidyltransferase|nr:CDP-diacylglycerol--glycerol-3-phosphate 3-phosphatidyltransferase [Deltaproteobacteria bacterium]